MHIDGALNVPRGILETACEYDYEETLPELADARECDIVLICRSGKRSVLAADVMQQMGYKCKKCNNTGMFRGRRCIVCEGRSKKNINNKQLNGGKK